MVSEALSMDGGKRCYRLALGSWETVFLTNSSFLTEFCSSQKNFRYFCWTKSIAVISTLYNVHGIFIRYSCRLVLSVASEVAAWVACLFLVRSIFIWLRLVSISARWEEILILFNNIEAANIVFRCNQSSRRDTFGGCVRAKARISVLQNEKEKD